METFLTELRDWGLCERAILGIAIVGSHARGMAPPEAAVDLVILLDDPFALAHDPSWMARFGTVQRVSHEDPGLIQSTRIRYPDGKEVTFVRELVKVIPYVGSVAGAAVAWASTYALGRAFCFYYQAVCEGHVPDAQALKKFYHEQYAAAEKTWKDK